MNHACPTQPAVTLEVPPYPDNLVIVRMMVGLIAEALGFAETETLQLELSVDEACANSIAAMQENGVEETVPGVRVEIAIEERCLQIAIIDRGRNFSEHFERALPFHEGTDRTRKRGYGLQIIKTLMDEVQYIHEAGIGNKLVLTKYRSGV